MSVATLVQIIEDGDIDGMLDLIENTLDRIDGEEWQEITADMTAALLPALILLRDDFDGLGDEDGLRALFSLDNAIRLSRNPDLPEEIQEGIDIYLSQIEGYDATLFTEDGTPAAGTGGHDAIAQQHDRVVTLFFDTLSDAAPE
jgi:hypothetical protein